MATSQTVKKKDWIAGFKPLLIKELCKGDKTCVKKQTPLVEACIQKLDDQILDPIQVPEEGSGLGGIVGT
jgi:hypothetical protein